MAEERYPGERRGLSLFLEELLPIVEAGGDAQALLRHAIRRALDAGDLARLRHARQIFNHLPRHERQALSAAMLGPRGPRAAAGEGEPAAGLTAEPAPPEAGRPAIAFELGCESETRSPLRVGLRHEPEPPPPVRVTIAPGTLPSVAADTLRRIAAMIEADRRLLSARFWAQGRPTPPEDDEQRDAR